MKVLLLNTYDTQGGAARAAYRLHQGLKQMGVNSEMLVKEKFSGDPSIIAPQTKLNEGLAKTKQTFEALPLKLYRQRQKTSFATQWLPDTVTSQVKKIAPDVINLHWLNSSYVQIETLAKLKLPLVWTLHDMWPFTGGCLYTQGCDRYLGSCGCCPQLGSKREWDLSRWVWQRKAKAWKNLNLTLVTLNSWMADCVKKSPLFTSTRIELIPNGIDIKQYKPIAKQVAREILSLPQNKKLILFGSLKAVSDRRKGFSLLQATLQKAKQSQWHQEPELVIFGASYSVDAPDFGFRTHYLGTFADDLALSIVYSAADVFILPSTQDNLPNTIMEAIACGTPCAAFNIGGIPQLIEHEKNGYLAQPFQVEDLAQGLIWILKNQNIQQKLSDYARQKVEREFTLELQAQNYLNLFTELQQANYLS